MKSNDRAIIIHRITKVHILKHHLAAGQDLRQKQNFEKAKIDTHRVYYGWYRGLEKSGWQVKFIERSSYLVPEFVSRINPRFYIFIITKLLQRNYSLFFRLAKKIDALLFTLHLLFLIYIFRPRFILFPYAAIRSRKINAICKQRGIKTISYFGVIPELQGSFTKDQVAEYDCILSGYDLGHVWPEVANKVYRIFLGPSEESEYVTTPDQQKEWDVSIIGGVGDSIFQTRTDIINRLLPRLKQDGININVYGYDMGGGNLAHEYPLLKQVMLDRIYGDQFYQVIKRSKIMLSIPSDLHIQIGATRPQGIMEPAAMQTFQIAYDTADTRAIFRPETEIVLFKDVDDLVDKIKYYLSHEEERKQIAQNAYNRFLREYTGEKQIQKMVRALGL